MHLLDRPAAPAEAGRQVVEQVRVRGRLAAEAEVAGRADEAGAEVVQPDAVDQHAGRQRVLRVGDGAGQPQAAAAVAEGAAILAGDHFEELPRHRLAGAVRVAAAEDARLVRRRGIDEYHRPRRRGRAVGPPLFDRLAQLLQLGLRRPIGQ